jgi:hypothetical protein
VRISPFRIGQLEGKSVALWGWGREGRESRAAMNALATRPEWREDALVERFAQDILPQLDAAELRIEPLLVLDEEQRIPPQLWERLRAHLSN